MFHMTLSVLFSKHSVNPKYQCFKQFFVAHTCAHAHTLDIEYRQIQDAISAIYRTLRCHLKRYATEWQQDLVDHPDSEEELSLFRAEATLLNFKCTWFILSLSKMSMFLSQPLMLCA